LGFIDAVKELADAAGMEMPARSPEQAAREEQRARAADVLESAAAWYERQLRETAKAADMLAARGVDAALGARFGLGLAPSRISVAGCGAQVGALEQAGLLIAVDNGYRDRFRGRFMIPIHDHRGRLVGFGARASREGQDPKYLNSPQSDTFDKGRILYNFHRAAAAARQRRRLVIVEGYFDVIGCARAGIEEAVAPMGTAITPAQLERAWSIAHAPVLMLDGDAAGARAAMKACATALPLVGPGKTLTIALLPQGQDPDDMTRPGADGAVDAGVIEAAIAAALPLHAFVWDAALGEGDLLTPEGKAGLWARLAALAETISDPETREQYLADWRSRFDAAFPPPPAWARDFDTLPSGSIADLAQAGEAEQELLRRSAEGWLLGRVERWAEVAPERDDVLRLAFTGGRRVGAGLLVRERLVEACWPQTEVIDDLTLADVDKAVDRGMQRPWDIGPDLLNLRCMGFPMTDFGIGERFMLRFGEDFLFTTAKGWLGWDKRRWNVLDQDKDGPPPAELQAALFDTIRAIQDEARSMARSGVRSKENPHGRDRWIPKGKDKFVPLSDILAQFGRQSEQAGKPTSIAKLAQKWLTRAIEDFDTDLLSVNVMNGTLKFRRERVDGARRAAFELVPHARADLNTRLVPVEYDENAESPLFDDFLIWAQPDADVRRYLAQVMGYTMTGETGEQKLWFHYGRGGNGKSVFFDTVAYVMGDYSGTIGIETFLDQGIKKRGEQASPDLARLGGVRFLRASEPERGARLNEALVKAATGGEPLAVRALHRGFFDLRPRFKLHAAGNYKPDIPGTDEGIWRRLKLILWGQHRAEHERDDHLPDKIKAEAAGVFRWMVAGLMDWLEHGLTEPSAVTEATAEYRDDSDPIARFLKMCVEISPNSRVQSSHLHEVYAAWCRSAGENEWKPPTFAKALKEKGWKKKTSNGVRWLDMRLIREARDFVDSEGKVIELADDDGRALAGGDGGGAPPPPDWADDDDFVPGFDP
jgi:DNA primase catalytic core